ncbi:uncharacterized protein LOC127416361 isoform X1 [Myxocyprinus asiaticus]|uniref:uncharacterized protein LOC127416361 isoform X1 n=1 Tax=Myxocyprinus asiaticus TaxID=70543 RepID=UPI002223A286|nr:uncharacterized protein LOC127416361 isoform X1 [Myxocyprinus asiaticus]
MAQSRGKVTVELELKRECPSDDENPTLNDSNIPARSESPPQALDLNNSLASEQKNCTAQWSVKDGCEEDDDEICPIKIGSLWGPQMAPCGPRCGKKCSEKIPYVRRKEIFDIYQDMSHSEKWTFVSHTVTQSLKKRLTTDGPSRRSKTFQYHLNNSLGEPQDVCKPFYLTTLGYHPKNDRVIISVIGNPSATQPPQDRRGRHPPANKLDLSLIREHIESFNPTVSAHAPNRRHLPSSVSIMKMYKDFKSKSTTPCSYETYRKAIRDMNISFTKPGEDEKCKKDIHGKAGQQ